MASEMAADTSPADLRRTIRQASGVCLAAQSMEQLSPNGLTERPNNAINI